MEYPISILHCRARRGEIAQTQSPPHLVGELVEKIYPRVGSSTLTPNGIVWSPAVAEPVCTRKS